MRVIGQPAAIVGEEFLSQAEDFVGVADGVVDPCVHDTGSEPGLLGSPSAVAEPRVFDGVINDPLFGGTARHQAGRPVRSSVFERFRVFVQQHQRRGPHAVLDGVELGTRFSRYSSRSAAFLTVPAIRFQLGLGDCHGIDSSSQWAYFQGGSRKCRQDNHDCTGYTRCLIEGV